MAQFIGYLIPIPFERVPVLRPKRTLAVAAIIALLTATVAPGWAAAAEPDSEGEGTAPPGLEDPHFEPGGEEAPLEILPGAAESESGAEEVEGPPIESEPPQEPELPEPASEAAPPVVVEGEPPPPAAEAPAPAPPEYAPAAPEYVPPAPSPAPVENEPIVAPPGAAEPPPRSEPSPAQPEPPAAPEAVAEAPPAVVPGYAQEAPLREPPPPAPVAAAAGSEGVSLPLRGYSSYTVRPGDCLWWIAEALLPSGARNAEVAAKVAWLWRRNADRIGTGDPNVLLVGTVLELA